MKTLSLPEIRKIESITAKIMKLQSELYTFGLQLETINKKSFAEKIDNAAFELDTAIQLLEQYEDWQ